jgi:hypothetical protein
MIEHPPTSLPLGLRRAISLRPDPRRVTSLSLFAFRRLQAQFACLLGLSLAPGLRAEPPLLPLVRIPSVSVDGRPYLPDSPALKPALAASGHDREEGELILACSFYSSVFQQDYYGQTFKSRRTASYDPRTDELTFLTGEVTEDPETGKVTHTSTLPFSFQPEHQASLCVTAGGKYITRRTVNSRCMVRHRLLRTSQAARHTWSAPKVSAAFATTPVSTDCNPTTAAPQVRSYATLVPRNSWTFFDVTGAGFRNEFCLGDGSWTLTFNPGLKANEL